MKKVFLVFIISSAMFACSEATEIPAEFIPKDKMVQVLIDVHLAESTVSSRNMPQDSAAVLYKMYENQIFQKHGVTDSLYRKSYKWYIENVEVMDDVYEEVVDSLSLREARGITE